MIIHSDAAQLEWRSYLEMSGDEVGINELINKVDVHTNNQQRFSLPSRLVSKTFLFRWIYRGSAYAYSVDNDFMPTSTDIKFWQSVIDAANEKYHTLYEFQEKLIAKAKRHEVITIPSGREFLFEMDKSSKPGGEFYWNINKITNYVNQGFGADLMALVRIILRIKLEKRYKPGTYLFMNTVHDSIELDVDNDPELLYNICIETENAFTEVSTFYSAYYRKPFRTPIVGEVKFGVNQKDLFTFKREGGKEQFRCVLT